MTKTRPTVNQSSPEGAPHHRTASAPYHRTEGAFNSFDSTKIFYQGWTTQKPRATVVITHGHGEHSESYERVVNHFENKGYDFWAWDMRGHGRSDGIRGYAKCFQDYIQDYGLFLDLIVKKVSNKTPIFLLSHSMGGLVQLSGLVKRNQSEFKAQTLSAPLLGVAVAIPAFKKYGAELLEKFFPKVTLDNEVDNEMLTREPQILREFDKDPLRHNKISSGVYLGFLKQIDEMMSKAMEVSIPTLFQCPEKDPICSTEATRMFSEKMNPSKVKFLAYGDGARHEMFNDTHRGEVFNDLESFFETQLKGPASKEHP